MDYYDIDYNMDGCKDYEQGEEESNKEICGKCRFYFFLIERKRFIEK